MSVQSTTFHISGGNEAINGLLAHQFSDLYRRGEQEPPEDVQLPFLRLRYLSFAARALRDLTPAFSRIF